MPSWFPGARFKRRARKWCRIVDNALQTIHDKVKGDLVSLPWCLASVGVRVANRMCNYPLHVLGLWNGCSVGCREYDIKT